MRHVLVVAALCSSVLFAATAEARKPTNRELMVACNKGWGMYHEANPGVKHKGYMSECLSGKITPPVPTPEPAETRRR